MLILFSMPVWAEQDSAITGLIQQTISLRHANTSASDDIKKIQLLEYTLSSETQEALYQRAKRKLAQKSRADRYSNTDTGLPYSIQLGMGRVPVLDQGLQGACVVFAMTAALDAALDQGDYISRLCLLQLGNYLEAQNQGASGWHGSNIHTMKSRIEKYGLMTITQQHQHGCAGYRWFPSYFFAPSAGMTPEEYSAYHIQPLHKQVAWRFLFKNRAYYKTKSTDSILPKLKTALNSGSRVVVSVFLPRKDLGMMGATGMHHFYNDTWVLTDEMAQDLISDQKMAGHTMVMTGYDDRAIVKDRTGGVHRGVFTLRNSWTPLVGHFGDFYMSYDYADVLVDDALMVKKLP